MKKQEYLTSFLTTAQESASACAERSEKAMAQFEQTNDTDVKRIAQKNATHAKYNGALSQMTEQALSVAYTHKLDPSAIVAQSRELKKRLMGALEAIAHNNKSALDKALLAFVAEIVATGKAEWTLKQIQSAMGHATDTQARYFKNWASFLGFGQYDKNTKTITVDENHSLFKKMVALFD